MFEVEAILDKRVIQNNSRGGDSQIEYLVKWQGYGDEENQWKPVEELTFVGDLIEEYEKNVIKNKKKKRYPQVVSNSKMLRKSTRQS